MLLEIIRTTPIYRSPAQTGVFIQWDIQNPPTVGISHIKIERSGSPEGAFELVINNMINSFHYFDSFRSEPAPLTGYTREPLNFLSLSRQVYYRVTAYAPDETSAATTKEINNILPRRQALLKQKIQRDITIGFKFNGVPLAILKRMHWGTRCSACFDLLTKKVTRSKCDVCFGTGFMGGYFSPIRISGRLGVKNIITDITPQGKADTNLVELTMLDYPLLEVDDVIACIRTNERYLVKKVMRTELQTVPVHQKIILSEISRDASEYRLLINYDTLPIIY